MDDTTRTLESYRAAAATYVEHSTRPGAQVRAYLDQFAGLVGTGTVLELGSGPGWDAAYLEAHGPVVLRTDAVEFFVESMRKDGHRAEQLDILDGDYGGPFDAVLANAVLLHLTRPQFRRALTCARLAVVDDGTFAFTLKEGDGEAWSTAKLGLPRYFTYWREPAVRRELAAAGWRVLSLDHVQGRDEPWMFVLARAMTQHVDADRSAPHTSPMSDLPEVDVPESPATWENVVVGEATELVGRVLHDRKLIDEGDEQKDIAREVREKYETEHDDNA